MRYTLRLLTAQQFQRAATLICACEVRPPRAEPPATSGGATTPFRIGMWVGGSVSANKTQDAAPDLDDLQQHRAGPRAPAPTSLVACPWCGRGARPARDAKLAPPAVADADHLRRLEGPLPVHRQAVGRRGDPGGHRRRGDLPAPARPGDRDGRQVRPAPLAGCDAAPCSGGSRVIAPATASVPPTSTPGAAIREASSTPARPATCPPRPPTDCLPRRPPDLIIQDELHLIAGPLGSLFGLYETAIDQICRRGRSTASRLARR